MPLSNTFISRVMSAAVRETIHRRTSSNTPSKPSIPNCDEAPIKSGESLVDESGSALGDGMGCTMPLTDRRPRTSSCFAAAHVPRRVCHASAPDGAGSVDTYTLIRNAFGPDPIEAPDLYLNNHPGTPHIIKDTDADVKALLNRSKLVWESHSSLPGSFESTTACPCRRILNTASWAAARGQWLSVSCLATFTDQGSLALTVTTTNGQVLLTTIVNNLDMWRAGDFVRPKWGIYRSLADSTNLRPDEETVRFANFSASKVRKCGN